MYEAHSDYALYLLPCSPRRAAENATKRQHVHFSVQTTAGGRERTIEIVTN